MVLGRGVDVLRTEGLAALLDRGSSYLLRPVLRPIERWYYLARGRRDVTIGPVTAAFPQADRRDVGFVGYFNEHEAPTVSRLLPAVRPDDTVFDVGAHLGYYSCFLGQVAARVVAFEPDPRAADRLRRNLSANGLDDDVAVVEAAAADRHGRTTFGDPGRGRALGSGQAAIRPDAEEPPADAALIDVETVSIDRAVAEGTVPPPDVVKVDVEGAEGLVLAGMRDTLRTDDCRLVLCEVHADAVHRTSVTDYGHTRSDVEATLTDAGFRTEVVTVRGSDTHVLATKV